MLRYYAYKCLNITSPVTPMIVHTTITHIRGRHRAGIVSPVKKLYSDSVYLAKNGLIFIKNALMLPFVIEKLKARDDVYQESGL